MLAVVYLVFNAGYGPPVRRQLCAEAIRLAALLALLMPDEAEVHGLHALLLLQDARRDARVSAEGELVLLEEQDRALWDETEIDAGRAALDRAIALRMTGPYQVQAAIASLHAEPETDWRQIALLYARLVALTPSPVVELNAAVAVSMADGPESALRIADGISGLDDYYLWHAARADFLRRLDRERGGCRRLRARAGAGAERRGARVPARPPQRGLGAVRSSASQPTSNARARSSASPPPRRPNSRFAQRRYAATARLITSAPTRITVILLTSS